METLMQKTILGTVKYHEMDEWPRKLLDSGLEVRTVVVEVDTEFGWGREDPEGTMDWDTMLEVVDCEICPAIAYELTVKLMNHKRSENDVGYYAVVVMPGKINGREES